MNARRITREGVIALHLSIPLCVCPLRSQVVAHWLCASTARYGWYHTLHRTCCLRASVGLLLLPTDPEDFETLLTLSARRVGFAVVLDYEALMAAAGASASGGTHTRFQWCCWRRCG